MDHALSSATRRILTTLDVAPHAAPRDPAGRLRARDGGQEARDALDGAAMQRVQAGDPRALAELMHRNWAPLVRYASTFLSDADTAEDVVQETFLRTWERRGSWEPTGPVRSYLYRIVRNLSLQEQERRGVRRRWREAQAREEQSAFSPADEAEAADLRSALERAVSDLPARRREVVALARFHDLTYQEIADVMGISAQTVANQLSAALAELRRVLAAFREP